MRFTPTIFSQLVEPLDRRRFEALVARRGADAYDKSFRCWEHLMALIHAQLTGASSLRALAASWNAHANAHYHLGCGEIARSTLADANARRPVEAFADVLAMVAVLTDRSTRAETKKLLRLIELDARPAGKTVRLGQVQRPHSRHEGPCRLRSGPRSAAHPRHHGRQRQRRPNRPPDRDRDGPDLCLRQGLLPLRLVEGHSRRRGLLCHPAQKQHGPDRQGGTAIRALARRRLHRDRRPGGRVVEQRRLQAVDPAAPHRNRARRGRKDDLRHH